MELVVQGWSLLRTNVMLREDEIREVKEQFREKNSYLTALCHSVLTLKRKLALQKAFKQRKI
jgi:6-phosphogluconate dehydrogenase